MFFQTQEIQKEYRRLDGICGLDTTYMPIKRYRQKGKTVAMCEFTSHSAIPVQFMFNLYYLDWLPETDCIDVIRHEYAHAAAALLFGPASLRGSGHGPLWQRVCAMVDCRPSPYTYNLNVLEPLATKKQVKGPDLPGPMLQMWCHHRTCGRQPYCEGAEIRAELLELFLPELRRAQIPPGGRYTGGEKCVIHCRSSSHTSCQADCCWLSS